MPPHALGILTLTAAMAVESVAQIALKIGAAGGPHWLGPVTPVGGIALILGWLWVAAAAWAGDAAAVAALRAFYGLHLGRDWPLFDLVRAPSPHCSYRYPPRRLR